MSKIGRHVDGTPAEWDLVAEAVRSRREELGQSREAAAAASFGKVSVRAWAALENREQDAYTTSTLLAVCQVLGWSHDSISSIMAGQPAHLVAGFEVTEANFRATTIEAQLRELTHRARAQEQEIEGIRSQFALLRSEIVGVLGRLGRLPQDPQSDPE